MKKHPTTRQLERSIDRMDAALMRWLAGPQAWYLIAACAVLDLYILIQILTSKAP